MIQLPQRSVTRFFIPLIDVLTLLFCIFLVMPLAQSNEESLAEELKAKEAELERLRNEGGDTRALQDELARLRKQLLLPERFPPTRVLEINAKTGRLFYRDPDVIEISNQKEAEELVKRDRSELGVGKGQLYYLILYPRDRSSEHPLNYELDEYAKWFAGVKLKYDIPGKGLIQGAVAMTLTLFAAFEMLSHPDKLLAIVGGAAVGGFGLGWLVQMAVRGWTGQQVPRWVLMTLRVLAGGVSGWLVALWVLGSGGGGLGGPGGGGFGGSNGENKPAEKKAKDETEHKDDDPARKVTTLYVEVLGSGTLNRMGEKNLDRCYRVEMPNGARLMTLKEVEDYIKQRAMEKPPLKALTIVLYNDGPSRNVPKVSDLADWASVPVVAGSEERLSVGYERRQKDAPVE